MKEGAAAAHRSRQAGAGGDLDGPPAGARAPPVGRQEGATSPPVGGHESAPAGGDERTRSGAPPVGQETLRPPAPVGFEHQQTAERAGAPPAGEDGSPARGTGAFLYAVLLLVPIGLFLAPLATFIVWRLRRREPFVDFHGRQSMDLVLGAMAGAAVHVAGRALDGVAGIGLQWAGFVLMGLQGLLVVWGMVDAGRGRMRSLPLSLPVLRWTQRRGPASATHG